MVKALAKACSYRMLTTAEVFAIAWFSTGAFDSAGHIAGITCVTSTLIYIGHDYLFHKVTNKKES